MTQTIISDQIFLLEGFRSFDLSFSSFELSDHVLNRCDFLRSGVALQNCQNFAKTDNHDRNELPRYRRVPSSFLWTLLRLK